MHCKLIRVWKGQTEGSAASVTLRYHKPTKRININDTPAHMLRHLCMRKRWAVSRVFACVCRQ